MAKSFVTPDFKRVTAADVAKLAGVSQPTVSRVFTPGISVSPETTKKVLAAAQQLSYKPNAIARSLTSHRTNIIGIVTGNQTSPFYTQALAKFTNELQKAGRQVLLFNIDSGEQLDDDLFRVLQYQVDGLIITAATLSSNMADECMRLGIPVFLFNRYILGGNVHAVCCDNVEGGRTIANLLLDTRHKLLAYLGGPESASTNLDRRKGYIDRLRERGVINVLIENGDYTYDSGREAAIRLFQGDNHPDAIFCASDFMAIGAMDAARFELGLGVPEDVSIVGFDDIPEAAWPPYSLTTIRQPLEKMTDATLNSLLACLDNNEAEQPTLKLFKGELINRGTVRQRN